MNNPGLVKRAGQLFRGGIKAATIVAIGLLCAGPGRAAPLQVLHGQVPAAVAALNLKPIGRLPGTNRLTVAIGLPGRNQQALRTLLQQLYDPASTNYRQFLSTERRAVTKAFSVGAFDRHRLFEL